MPPAPANAAGIIRLRRLPTAATSALDVAPPRIGTVSAWMRPSAEARTAAGPKRGAWASSAMAHHAAEGSFSETARPLPGQVVGGALGQAAGSTEIGGAGAAGSASRC